MRKLLNLTLLCSCLCAVACGGEYDDSRNWLVGTPFHTYGGDPCGVGYTSDLSFYHDVNDPFPGALKWISPTCTWDGCLVYLHWTSNTTAFVEYYNAQACHMWYSEEVEIDKYEILEQI